MADKPIVVVRVELSGTEPIAIIKPAMGRTARLRKLLAYNNDSASHTVEIGSWDGSTFTPLLAKISVAAGSNTVLSKDELPAAELVGDGVRSLAARLEASATNPVELALEIEVL